MHSVSTLFVAALLAPVEALVLTTGARPSPTAMARSRNILLEEPPPPPSGGRLGGTIDQDGKSNVWVRILHTYGHGRFRCGASQASRGVIVAATPRLSPIAHTTPIFPLHFFLIIWQAVEPSMKVDKADKGLLVFAPVVGVAALAFLSIPLLPALFAANPDQA